MKTIPLRLLAVILFALPAGAQTITTRTLDFGSGPNGNTGQFTSQAIVNGNPAIAYYNSTETNLMFARNSAADGSGTWTITTVDDVGDVGWYTSLEVVNGNPAIGYRDASNGALKYVRALDADGTSWGTPVTLDSTGSAGYYTSLAAVNGIPAISYYDSANGTLKFVRAQDANGASWGAPVTLDSTGFAGSHTSLAVVIGNPAISYYDGTNGNLKYVWALDADGTTWGTPVTVASAGDVGRFTSLVVVNGNPAISYYGNSVDLHYVRALDVTGASWGTPVTLDSTGNVGSHTSLAVVNGNPAVSYHDATNGDLKYVRALDASGTSWGTRVTLDSFGDVGQYTSLAVVAGSPAISYYDSTNRDLKYVRAFDSDGINWAAPTTPDAGVQSGDVGQHTSQAIVNGNPAISYYDPGSGDLKYMRALDAGGTNWGAPVTLDSTGNVGLYTSLAVVNGNPAITYYDTTNDDLKYVRALDAGGTSWGTPVTLDSTGNVGQYTSLAVVNGNPAISYYDGTNLNLKYVRALDAGGTSWDTPVTLDSTGNMGQYNSLTVVNGIPAVSYYDATNLNLKYVRALDAGGTSWGAPVTLDSTGTVGLYTSLAVVNGIPAVSYYDATNFDLKYVRALDAGGTSWGTPVALDSTGSVGQYTSLAIIAGKPAVSYYDSTNFDLKYVRAQDAGGTSWGTPVTLDSIGNVGTYTSLALVNGNAAISYYDSTNGSLKWATYVTAADIVVTQVNSLNDGVGSVAFGSVLVGASSAALTFTIANPGTADLTSLVVGKNGTNAADFSVSALSDTSIPAGPGTVTFTVTFNPTAAGARNATLHIASNVSGTKNPFDINLSGTGLPAPEIVVEQPAGTNLIDNSAIVDFGNTPVDNPSTRIFTIKNTGPGSLTGLGITIDGTDAGLFSVIANPKTPVSGPSGSTTFTVRFAPNALGPLTANLHIASNDVDENPFDIVLQGAGTPAAGALALDGTGFTVNETDGTVTIPIKRTGGSFGSVTVNVSTTNGTAMAPGDFTALTNFPVTILDGATTGSATVTIANTGTSEVNETFTVTLSGPAGGATLGSPKSAPVTIIDSTSLSNLTDTAAPFAPTISAPTASALVSLNTGDPLSITGNAADNKGVKQVRLSLNNGAFADAALGTPGAPTTAFTFPLTPLTGLNTIQVKSIDYANRESPIVTRSFTVLRPLAVNFSGPGTGTVTTGFAPMSFRQVGKTYIITATPTAAAAPGFAFNGWTVSGGPTPSDIGVTAGALELPALTFVFRENLVLTANFIANPFAAAVTGAFNGLITPSNSLPAPNGSVQSNETVGKVTATVGGTGVFSGTLYIDGMSLGFAGVFDNTGTGRFGTNRATTFTVVRTTKPSYDLTLHLDLAPAGTNKMTGTLTQHFRSAIKSVSTLDADRAFYNGTTVKVPANLAGTASKAYTVNFPAKGLGSQPAGFTLADYPQGDGYATVTVSINGTVSLVGKLADGTDISASAPLSKTNTWPLFKQLYPVLGVNKGCLAGQITLDDTQVESDMAGTNLLWFRPFQLVQWYPFGWNEGVLVDLLGAKYVVPPATPATSVFPGPGPATALKAVDLVNGNVGATFSDGQLSGGPITRGVNISPTNVATRPTSNTDTSFTLTITTASGIVTGAFTHTDGTKPAFQGVIIQKGTQRGAYGYFLTKQPAIIDYTGESGGINLIGK